MYNISGKRNQETCKYTKQKAGVVHVGVTMTLINDPARELCADYEHKYEGMFGLVYF